MLGLVGSFTFGSECCGGPLVRVPAAVGPAATAGGLILDWGAGPSTYLLGSPAGLVWTGSGAAAGVVAGPQPVLIVRGSMLHRIDRALAARLIARGLGTDKTIFFYDAQPSRPIPDAGDPQFCLWPGAQRAIESWEQGGGRLNTGVDGTLKVGIWSSQTRDRAYRAERMLNDDDRGVVDLATKVVDALQEFFPFPPDAVNFPLTARGLRFLDWTEAQEHQTAKGWTLIVVTFAVRWRMDLTMAF